MFKLFNPKQKKLKEAGGESLFHIAQTGAELVNTEERQEIIRKIKRLYSVTEEVWNHHYLFAIHEFAELVQLLPASEIHHHSKPGGLLDHTLEALHVGSRIMQGYVLPPNSEPEDITANADRWRYGAFIAILAHDLGKILTDIEVAYRLPGESDFRQWHPWYENIPTSAEYQFRYKDKTNISKVAKAIHEKASMSLLPRIITKSAAQYIFQDHELLSQIFSTIVKSTFGGQAISEIVSAADRSSVAENLGANTGIDSDYSTKVPTHEKIIVALRQLIQQGDLKQNKPGAALWITQEETWAVSRPVMEAVQNHLNNEGHKGIPKNPVRLFEILREHELIAETPEGESVWTATINDQVRGWEMRLTFLRFKNDILFPNHEPNFFDGTVTPVVKKSCDSTSEETTNQSKPIVKSSTDSSMRTKAANKIKGGDENQIEIPIAKKIKIDSEKLSSESVNFEPKKEVWIQAGNLEKPNFNGVKRHKEKDLLEIDFFNWLIRGVKAHQIRVNEPKAMIHVLDDYIALVTPAIFKEYLKKNPYKKKELMAANPREPFESIQKEIQALGIHQKGLDGSNIVRMQVTGERSQSQKALNIYLLHRRTFSSFKAFASNKAMSISLSGQ